MIDEVWTKLAFPSKGMISAQGEAAEQLCQTCVDKHGQTWVWSDVDHIYCGFPYDTKSEGFGGAKIPFRLLDGKQVILHGPWHVGANDLWKSTGVDLRNQYLTRGMCSYARTYDSRDGYIYKEVFHYEEAPVSGTFHRICNIAKLVAHKTKRMVFYYVESHGGSVHSFEGREYEKDSEDQDTSESA